jgi:hypothetical protein
MVWSIFIMDNNSLSRNLITNEISGNVLAKMDSLKLIISYGYGFY